MRVLCKQKNVGMIIITHDMGVIADITDRVAVMYHGNLVEHGHTAKILGDPDHPYTQSLISAVPRPDVKLVRFPQVTYIEDIETKKEDIDISDHWLGQGQNFKSAKGPLIKLNNITMRFTTKPAIMKKNRIYLDAENTVSLDINEGEVFGLVGESGSGKSTLSYVLSGKNDYDVNEGSIHLKSKNIIDLEPDERSKLGLFLAFQYPIELPGVTGMTFLRTIINSSRLANNLPELEGIEIVKLIREKAANLEISQDMLKRFVNVGFSGGEKKRFEILQMSLLNPSIAILDETDSGLDVDALRIVGNGVTELKSKDRGMLVITHYQRLLDHIKPDVVHIMADGRIVKTGGPDLALEVENNGYSDILDEAS